MQAHVRLQRLRQHAEGTEQQVPVVPHAYPTPPVVERRTARGAWRRSGLVPAATYFASRNIVPNETQILERNANKRHVTFTLKFSFV